MKVYGDINKVEPQDDGTIKVWGIASAESADSVGEIVTANAMRKALPDFMKFGAIREMHQPTSAAGTAISAEVMSDGKTRICAHIVDPLAIKKVNTKVYKGFSIGGKVKQRDELNKNVITDIDWTELSLVDRPCHPKAVFDLYKADGLKKSLWDVGRLAEILNSLNYLRQDQEWEAEIEQDGSAIPAKLKKAVNNLAAILQELVKEETQEMTSKAQNSEQITPNKETTPVKYPPNDINTPTEVSPSQTPPIPDATKTDETKKADLNQDLAKAEQMNTVLTKMLGISETLNKVMVQNEDLAKRLKELESQPMPSKAALSGVAIEKAADSKEMGQSKEVDSDDPVELMKAVHARII